jgi:anti-sigma B factor antagonist
MALTIDSRDEENTTIISLDGDLDVSSSPQVKETLSHLLEQGRKRIVVDMSRVSYMDSSGLSAIVATHQSLRNRGTIALVGCKPNVERVLRFTQFDKVLDLYRNFEDYEAGQRDNLRAVSGVSKSVMMKQKAAPRTNRSTDRSDRPGRRLE